MTTDNPASLCKECSVSQADCIIWNGARTAKGYGVAHVGPTTTTAHRAAWVAARGPIAPGLELDHLCRNRLCVNVDHLEPVTSSENNYRAPRWQVTECPLGHPLDGENLYVQVVNGVPHRSCRRCRNERSRRG